jgi:hypothetical protein
LIKVFCFLLITLNAWAMPKKFEVWFLSTTSSKNTSYILDKMEKIKFGPIEALAKRQCQPMGDYCFDPHIGLYKMQGDDAKAVSDYTNLDSKENYESFDAGDGVNREMVNCEDGNFFDLYCGKAQKKVKQEKTKLEIWMDISSTMKQVDFAGYNEQCKRESMLRRLNLNKCTFGSTMKVYGFNESRKELGMMDRVCLNSGLNRTDRIIRDIKTSKASHLIIITDIFEASEEFIEFIESTGVGSHKGIDSPFYAEDLKAETSRLAKVCK